MSMKTHILMALFVGLLLVLSPVQSEPATPSEDPREVADYQGDVTPKLEPHGDQICASGCALSRHPTPPLTKDTFQKLMADYATQPMSEDSAALEELLYYGPQTRRLLGQADSPKLDSARLAFLETELKRERVVVEFRMIDEDDQVRVGLPPTTVSLDNRYVFEPLNTHDFQPPEASGTVKRVGLHHIWQRI